MGLLDASDVGPARVQNWKTSYAECDGLGLSVLALNCAAAVSGAYQSCATLNVPLEASAQGSSVLLGGFSIKASAAINITACVSIATVVAAAKIATMGGEIWHDALASRVTVQEGGIRAFDSRKSERSRFSDVCVIAPLKQAGCGGTPASWAVLGATYQCVGAAGRASANSDGSDMGAPLPPGMRLVGAAAYVYAETASCTASSTDETIRGIMALLDGSNAEGGPSESRGAALVDIRQLPPGLEKRLLAPIEAQILEALEDDQRNTTLLPLGDLLMARMKADVQAALQGVSGKVLLAWGPEES